MMIAERLCYDQKRNVRVKSFCGCLDHDSLQQRLPPFKEKSVCLFYSSATSPPRYLFPVERVLSTYSYFHHLTSFSLPCSLFSLEKSLSSHHYNTLLLSSSPSSHRLARIPVALSNSPSLTVFLATLIHGGGEHADDGLQHAPRLSPRPPSFPI